MSEANRQDRLYSEKEIEAILKRTAVLQSAEKTLTTEGLSFEEIQQVAQEAGLDPDLVALAVAEMDREGNLSSNFQLLGGPVSLTIEREISGEINPENWVDIVAVIQSSLKHAGTTSQVGEAFEWAFDTRNNQGNVLMRSREGKTKIRVYTHFPQMAILAFMPTLALTLQLSIIIPAILNLPMLGGWFLGLSMLITMFFIARFGYSKLFRRKEKNIQKMIDRIGQILDKSERASTRQKVGTAPPLIQPDETLPEASTPSTHRNRISS